MSRKQFYLPPETTVLPIRLEGPLCLSNFSVLMETGLSDYDLIEAGDITWDK